MLGEVCGLDMAQALASLDTAVDLDVARRLFVAAEIAFLSAHMKRGTS